MRRAINLAVISGSGLLLVRKKNAYILPGGKPEEGESDYEALERELSEELPGSEFKIEDYYGSFYGVTPYSGTGLEAEVYLGKIEKLGKPSAEISEAKFVNDFENYNLSTITEKIVSSLKEDGYF